MGHKGNNLNVTLPPDILKKIEEGAKAKDQSKSRFVLRLLEKGFELQQQEQVGRRKN
jgi:Ribbon-helix-helix protein, copG family.